MDKPATEAVQLMEDATRAFGSRVFFAKHLGATPAELQSWIDGLTMPTDAQIRAAAEVLKRSL